MMTTIVITMITTTVMTRITTMMTTGNQLAAEKEKRKRGPHKGVKKLLVACTKNLSLFANMF